MYVIHTYIPICIHTIVCVCVSISISVLVLVLGMRRSRLSNTICLTQAFFKSYKS